MKNYINSIASTMILMSLITVAPIIVKAQTNGEDDSVAPAEVVISVVSTTSNGSDDVSAPGTSNGSDDVSASKGSTSNGSDDVAGSQTTNGSDDMAPVAQATTPSTCGPSSSSGGGSIYSSSGRSSRIMAPTNGVCSVYLNDYLKLGGNNNQAEVIKLQTFLKNVEKLDVDINSTFDSKTFEAVKSFQKKYSSDILLPWGSNNPTGQVYFTTKKKINEIYCNVKLSLTAEQLAQIESYKKGVQNPAVDTSTNNTDLNINPSSTTPLTPEVGINVDNTQAAAVSTSIPSKIWKFIKWVFGY